MSGTPRTTFAFEAENNETLAWIPLDVRRKLDLAGVRLSLSTWTLLSREDREGLCDAGVASDGEADSFRAHVIEAATRVGHAANSQTRIPFTARPWSSDAAHDAIVARAKELGVTVARDRLGALGDAAQYALYRLADPQKTEEKLRAALAELVG